MSCFYCSLSSFAVLRHKLFLYDDQTFSQSYLAFIKGLWLPVAIENDQSMTHWFGAASQVWSTLRTHKHRDTEHSVNKRHQSVSRLGNFHCPHWQRCISWDALCTPLTAFVHLPSCQWESMSSTVSKLSCCNSKHLAPKSLCSQVITLP